jgi:hypothetical protein
MRAEHQHAGVAERIGICSERTGTYGNAGFNSLQGPSFFDMDATLSRYFPIREHQRIELRFEFFNVLNHVNSE